MSSCGDYNSESEGVAEISGDESEAEGTVFLHHYLDCKNSPDDIEKMKKILAEDPRALERKDPHYYADFNKLTPLQNTVMHGHDKCFKFLLECGADPTLRAVHSYLRENLMELAVTSEFDNNDIMVKILLDMGFSPNFEPEKGGNLQCNKTYYLTSAIYREKFEAAQYLLDYGAVIDDFDGYDITFDNCRQYIGAINDVLFCGLPKRLRFFLMNGAPVDIRGVKLSKNSDSLAVADYVRKDCFSLIHHFVCGYPTPFLWGFEQEKEALDLLHQFGANFWEENRYGLTPLQVRENRKIWLRERHFRGLQNQLLIFSGRYLEIFNQTTEYLKQLMLNPLSLSSWCRLTLARTLKTNYLKKLDALPPLPKNVKEFLQKWP